MLSLSASRIRRMFASSLLLAFLLPHAAQAASTAVVIQRASAPAHLIQGDAKATVSRGDFLRSSMKALRFELIHDTKLKPFDRTPAALLPYVQTAHALGALKVFGKTLNSARPITRSEAIQVLVGLEAAGETATDPLPPYADVKTGSDEAKALAVAVQRGWVEPDSLSVFGAKRLLTVGDAEALLGKVLASEGISPESGQIMVVPVVRMQPDRQNKPLPKEAIQRAVWDLLQNDFLYKDRIDEDKAGDATLDGLVDQLKDPYTVYMPKAKSESYQQQLEGEITGIGASVEKIDDFLVIVAPLPGSPAEKAGLKPRDIILMADGVDLKGMDLDEAVGKVRGVKGTTVKLRIRRDGMDFDVSVVRDTIKNLEIQVDWNGTIAIVRLLQFGTTTERDIRKTFEDIAAKNPKGVILDLRNDPGGLIQAAEETMSNFLPKGSTYVQTISQGKTSNEVTEHDRTLQSTVPMIVLVNKGSASASEIVAAALQDAGRAKILGETTFGKGTFQRIYTFNDGSSLKMTIGEWRSPNGKKIDKIGVVPDISMPSTNASRDEMLLRAIDLLR